MNADSLIQALYVLDDKKVTLGNRLANPAAFEFAPQAQDTIINKNTQKMVDQLQAAINAMPAGDLNGPERQALNTNIHALQTKLNTATDTCLNNLIKHRHFDGEEWKNNFEAKNEIDAIKKIIKSPIVDNLEKQIVEIRDKSLPQDIDRLEKSVQLLSRRAQLESVHDTIKAEFKKDEKTRSLINTAADAINYVVDKLKGRVHQPPEEKPVWTKIRGPLDDAEENNKSKNQLDAANAALLIGGQPVNPMLDGGYGLYHRKGSNWMIDFREGPDGQPIVETIQVQKTKSKLDDMREMIGPSDSLMGSASNFLATVILWAGYKLFGDKENIPENPYLSQQKDIAMFKLGNLVNESNPSMSIGYHNPELFSAGHFQNVRGLLDMLKDLKSNNNMLLDIKLTAKDEKMILGLPYYDVETKTKLLDDIREHNKGVAEARNQKKEAFEKDVAAKQEPPTKVVEPVKKPESEQKEPEQKQPEQKDPAQKSEHDLALNLAVAQKGYDIADEAHLNARLSVARIEHGPEEQKGQLPTAVAQREEAKENLDKAGVVLTAADIAYAEAKGQAPEAPPMSKESYFTAAEKERQLFDDLFRTELGTMAMEGDFTFKVDPTNDRKSVSEILKDLVRIYEKTTAEISKDDNEESKEQKTTKLAELAKVIESGFKNAAKPHEKDKPAFKALEDKFDNLKPKEAAPAPKNP